MNLKARYESVANELRDRILTLIPSNLGILNIDDPWKLHKVPGLKFDDLEPTLFQAGWALSNAKAQYKKDNRPQVGPEKK